MTWTDCLAPGPEKVATLDCVPVLFQNFVIAAFTLGGITAVIMIVLSGIAMITSGGDAKKMEGAQHTMTYAIIGLVIILLAPFIISLVGVITGTRCISTNLAPITWVKNCQ